MFFLRVACESALTDTREQPCIRNPHTPHNPHAQNPHSPAKLASHIHMQTQRSLCGGTEAMY